MTNFADRTIWTGDNLDILRGLNSASVDLIYLDTAFDCNQDCAAPVGSAAAGAVFKDTWTRMPDQDTWTLSDLDVAWIGLIADEQQAIHKVLDTAGLSHRKPMQSHLCEPLPEAAHGCGVQSVRGPAESPPPCVAAGGKDSGWSCGVMA